MDVSLEFFTTFINDGGIFMLVILLVFFLALCISLERYLRYVSFDLNASSFMNEIQKLIMGNKIKDAIQHCSGSKALLPRVIKNGLKRSNQTTDHVQNAIDATALEMIPIVEKRLNYLNLFANISTLLGLLGTIFGLIMAFSAVGEADPSQRAAILSSGISKAMNTTAFGLISAILIMIFHTMLTSKSEKIISDIDQYSVKLLDVLGTMKSS
jgi:biopolymer transport protein ExbB/TolQ